MFEAGVDRPDLETRVRALFDAVADVDAPSRRVLMDQARRTDPEAWREVEQLLGFHEGTRGVLDHGVASAAAMLTPAPGSGEVVEHHAEELPTTIATFRVLREVGQGGMGVVYEGEQEFPRRRVAIKVLRPELVTASLLRRFAHEAEALAMLQHPGIAHIYEAGFDDARRRRPYIAMELVEGVPFHVFIRETPLEPRDVMMMFAGLCDAVEHAHQRGVVHRDLKPGNVLVLADRRTKILDFGVARLAAREAQETMATSAGQIIGTIGYMSPEQLAGDPSKIDSRCDVYALGVMLYEALAGAPPVDVRGMTLVEAASAVREREPMLLGRVKRELRGDIEAIVAKALEKEPARRYQSAGELAADLRRALADEAVIARAPTTWYQAQKFARRNKVLVGGACAVVTALVLGMAGTAWQAREANIARGALANQLQEAERLRDQAKDEAQRARSVTEYLRELLMTAHPHKTGGKDITLRDAFEKAAAQVGDDFQNQPEVRHEVLQAMASSFAAMGANERAREFYAQALELAKRIWPDNPRRWSETTYAYATTLHQLGRGQEGAALVRDVRDRIVALDGAECTNAAVLGTALGMNLSQMGKNEEAERVLRESLSVHERLFGPEDKRTLMTLNSLALHLRAMIRYDEGAPLAKRNLEGTLKLYPAEHPDVIAAKINYASFLDDLQSFDEGVRLMEDAIPTSERILGPTHPNTLSAKQNYAALLLSIGRIEESQKLCEELLPLVAVLGDPTHDSTLSIKNTLALCYEETKRHEDAERLLLDVARAFESMSPNPPRIYSVHAILTRVQRAQKKYLEAEQSARAALASAERFMPERDMRFGLMRMSMGVAIALQNGREREGIDVMIIAHAELASHGAEGARHAARAARAIATRYGAIGDAEAAAEWTKRGEEPK